MRGGEIFIPKIPSVKIVNLAKAFKSNIPLKEIGLRPGEKLHEILLPKDSSHHSIEFKDYYVIAPEFDFSKKTNFYIDTSKQRGRKVPYGFEYNSLNNNNFLTTSQIEKILINQYKK